MNDTFRLACATAILAAPAFADGHGPFVVNTVQPPSTLDPAFACDIVGNGYMAPLYAPLVTYGRQSYHGPEGVTVTAENEQDIIPALAESWSVSDDGLVYMFTIREGAAFASGNPIDGAAVAASLARAWQSGACGTYYMEAGNFGNTQSIDAEGNTVTITLAAPEPLLIHALTQPNLSIVDTAVVEEMGGAGWLATNAAASGPYMLESYEPGVQAVFAANPYYFGEAPLEPEVVVNWISDPTALLLQARNGAADVTLGLPKQMVAELAGEMTVVEVPSPRFMIAALPNKVAPFDNPTFREALSYATPYAAIMDSVARGYGEAFFGPFPPHFDAYDAAIGGPRSFNMERAMTLLAESGVEGPVSLKMVVIEGNAEQDQIATILQGAWSQLGIVVSVSRLSAAAYVEVISTPEKTSAILRFDGPSLADPAWLLSYDMRCQSAFNQSNYCNEAAEGLLNEALAIDNLADRQPLWNRIAEIWVGDAPRIPLYADTFTAVLDNDVTAWDFAQDGPFDLQNWGR
ncbi:MAG: ABC transporter substrate-binding protein [Albidovulum sp.]|nr:ABC transporter substrate-binding protein [Albidovulum sp.]MDE0533836.1 ABC transporter substrate-binding protein [Albidovulum sp.]